MYRQACEFLFYIFIGMNIINTDFCHSVKRYRRSTLTADISFYSGVKDFMNDGH